MEELEKPKGKVPVKADLNVISDNIGALSFLDLRFSFALPPISKRNLPSTRKSPQTMQTRLMQLMADKLMCSLAIEGELSDKGLAALSETSDSMAKELAKMLIEKSVDNRNLKDIWADYRKKEVLVEMKIAKDITEPGPVSETISSEVEKIGDRIVKVQFVEYIGKRKKKVTHIEVKESELDEMIARSDKPIQAQFALF